MYLHADALIYRTHALRYLYFSENLKFNALSDLSVFFPHGTKYWYF